MEKEEGSVTVTIFLLRVSALTLPQMEIELLALQRLQTCGLSAGSSLKLYALDALTVNRRVFTLEKIYICCQESTFLKIKIFFLFSFFLKIGTSGITIHNSLLEQSTGPGPLKMVQGPFSHQGPAATILPKRLNGNCCLVLFLLLFF